jgi:hypothetical protein
MESFSKFMNSPVGPKTVHFWGPACNWALVAAAIADSNKPPEAISRNITATLFFYSLLFMRFAWRVQPRNLLLLSCHTANASMQFILLQKRIRFDMDAKRKKAVAPTESAQEMHKA